MIQAEFSRKSDAIDVPSSSCFANANCSGYENIDCGRLLKMDLNLLNENSYQSQPNCQDRSSGLPYAGNYALQVAASIASGDICSALVLRSDSRKYTKKSSEGSSKDSSRNQSTLPSTRCSTLRSFLSSSRSSSSGGTLKKEAKEAKEKEKRGFFSFFHWFRRKKLKRSRLEEDEYRRRRSNSVQSDTSISSSFHYVPVVFNSALSTGNSPIGDKKLLLQEIESKREAKEKENVSIESKPDELEIDCQNEENENIESVETNWANVVHDSLKTPRSTSKYKPEMTSEEGASSSSGIESNAKNKNRVRRSSTSVLHKKKRRAPQPPNQIKHEAYRCQVENDICLLPTSIANDSLNRKAIRQMKEKARLKKKRRAPSPPYKTIGINTEEITNSNDMIRSRDHPPIALPEDTSVGHELSGFVVRTDQIEDIKQTRCIDKREVEIQLNDLSKSCEGAEAAPEIIDNIKDNTANDYQKNCLRVTEEWKMGNITTQKLIDMFNEMANCNENGLWNIPPGEERREDVNKKESSTDSDEINMSMGLKTKVLSDKIDLLSLKEKMALCKDEPAIVENFQTLSHIKNLDEVEACIEALTSSFTDDTNNENQEQIQCELRIYENTMERKSALNGNTSSKTKNEDKDDFKASHLQNKWKPRNYVANNRRSSSGNQSDNLRMQQNSNCNLNIKPNQDETSVRKYECSGARPRLPQKTSKTTINNSNPLNNHVSKIRCNLSSDSEVKANEGRVGRNFSASFSSAYRSQSQIDTRRNSNPNSSSSPPFNDSSNNTRFDLLQQHPSPRYAENFDRQDRKSFVSIPEGKKALESNKGDSENSKVKITAPRRSNLRRHRRHAQKSMYELQENNRGYAHKGNNSIKEAYKKSLSLSSAYRSLGMESLNSEFNLNETIDDTKRSSNEADVQAPTSPRLLPDRSKKYTNDPFLNRASVSVSMAAKMVIKGQLWPSSFEIIAPELMFLRARLSGRKLPRFPRGDIDGEEVDAVEISKLLKQLEVAIGNGLIEKAAGLARKLAECKVKCSVVRKKSNVQAAAEEIAVNLFIEDRLSHTGPITLYINPNITVGQLKKKIQQEFHFPTYLQKWILGKKLADDDNATISSFNVLNGCAVFLYLYIQSTESEMYRKKLENYLKAVDDFAQNNSDNQYNNVETNLLNSVPKREEKEVIPIGWTCPECTLLNDPTRPGCSACTTARPDDYEIPAEYKLKPEEAARLQKERELEEEYRKEEERRRQAEERYKVENYQRFIDLDNMDIVLNEETFECPICLTDVEVGEGIVIRECVHNFCRDCVAHTVEYSDTAEVKCPFRDENYSCDAVIQDREIHAIVTPEVYEKHLQKSLIVAENQAANSFHCQTADCRGWCIYEDDVNEFLCPVCNHNNCLTCKAIHEGVNCKQYQDNIIFQAATSENARKTKEALDTMLREGNGMHCPKCGIIITKKFGCDWLTCSMCRVEICWVTKGPRWGPRGTGDITGGCRCGVNGKRCHQACGNCH